MTAGALPTGRWPATAASVVLAGLATAALYALLYVRNPRFFYIDDRVADALPKLVDIGRMVRLGEWPWLTTGAMNSGAHAVEYQNGVFNPVLVAFGVWLSGVDDMALGSFVIVLAHAVVLAGAAAWLARSVGLGPGWSTAVAVSVAFQPYTVFWGAAAWLQAVTSFTWFVLAVAAAVAFHVHPRRRYGWTLLAATYLCCTSGWPLAIPVLGAFVATLLAARLLTRSGAAGTLWLGGWYAGGVACALVGLYPLTRAFEVADRTSAIANESNFNVVSLDALLQFANPVYFGFFFNFDGYALQQLPHFYVAWFLLPVLGFLASGRVEGRARALLLAAVVMLAVTALATLGPERLLVFRFPTRFLQYSGFFLLLAAAVLVARGRFAYTRRRLGVVLGLTALLAVLALQADPDGARRVLSSALLTGALSTALYAVGRREGSTTPAWRPTSGGVVALGTLVVLVAVAWTNPAGRGIDWRFPADVSTVDRLSLEHYTLFYGNYVPADLEDAEGYHAEYHPSSTGLMVGNRQINGYSPLGHSEFRSRLLMDDQGNFAPGSAGGFDDVDPSTGLQLLELLKVDQVIAQRGPWADELQGTLGPPWQQVATRRYTEVWRHPGYSLPGLVSYAGPGLLDERSPGCGQTDLRECVRVQASDREDRRLVFARLWFPGYTATLDGVSLPVERHADMLVSVDVPRDAAGEVVLTYRSPAVRELAALAVLVLLGCAVASWRWHPTADRRGRADQRGGSPDRSRGRSEQAHP